MFRQLIEKAKAMLNPPKGRIVIYDPEGNPCVLLSRAGLETLISESYEAGANDCAMGHATKEQRDELVSFVSKAIKGMDEAAYET